MARQKDKRADRTRLMSMSIPFILFLVLTAALVPIAFAGWNDIYGRFLETSSPLISVKEFPRGIGRAPVLVQFSLTDQGSGLDEVVIRTRQRGHSKEILRQSLQGRSKTEINIEFHGVDSNLEEGDLELEVRAFDRSFWSNTGERIYPLKVDFRKPEIEVLSTQHNARHGGSQLVFYKAYDENLSVSGVKIGNNIFPGFKARGLDSAFQDTSVYAALYAVDILQDPKKVKVRLFAEDEVGNANTIPFYNKILPRRMRQLKVKLSDAFLRSQVMPLTLHNMPVLEKWAQNNLQEINFESPQGSEDRLIEMFELSISTLRNINNKQIKRLISQPRFEKLWNDIFTKQPGSISVPFGTGLKFIRDGYAVGTQLKDGYEIKLPRNMPDVYALNDGVVAFSENIGVYGRILGIDHGLGLFSLYGQLDNVVVSRGETVEQGQVIAQVGKSGLAMQKSLFFQMRIHGVPIDAREWWDTSWYYSHIVDKANKAKLALGIPVYSNDL